MWKCENYLLDDWTNRLDDFDDYKECSKRCNSLNQIPNILMRNVLPYSLNYGELNNLNQTNSYLQELIPLKTLKSNLDLDSKYNRKYITYQLEQKLLQLVVKPWNLTIEANIILHLNMILSTLSELDQMGNIIISPDVFNKFMNDFFQNLSRMIHLKYDNDDHKDSPLSDELLKKSLTTFVAIPNFFSTNMKNSLTEQIQFLRMLVDLIDWLDDSPNFQMYLRQGMKNFLSTNNPDTDSKLGLRSNSKIQTYTNNEQDEDDEQFYFDKFENIDFLNRLTYTNLLNITKLLSKLAVMEQSYEHIDFNLDFNDIWYSILVVWISKYLNKEIPNDIFWSEMYFLMPDISDNFEKILDAFDIISIDIDNFVNNIPTNSNFWITIIFYVLILNSGNQIIKNIFRNPNTLFKLVDLWKVERSVEFFNFDPNDDVIKQWLRFVIAYYFEILETMYAKDTIGNIINRGEIISNMNILEDLKTSFKDLNYNNMLNNRILDKLNLIYQNSYF